MARQKGSFTDALPAIIGGTEAGLKAAAEEIMAEADILVPKDTLTLAESRFIDEPHTVGTTISIKLGFGRGSTPNPIDGKVAGEYAVPVHEILEAKHAPPTQAKYLETPAIAYESQLGETVRKWISRYVRGEAGLEKTMEEL